MNKRFSHEHHNRQDKVLKESYRFDLRPAQNKNWSGVDFEKLSLRSKATKRKVMLRKYGNSIFTKPYRLFVCKPLVNWFYINKINVTRAQNIISSEIGRVGDSEDWDRSPAFSFIRFNHKVGLGAQGLGAQGLGDFQIDPPMIIRNWLLQFYVDKCPDSMRLDVKPISMRQEANQVLNSSNTDIDALQKFDVDWYGDEFKRRPFVLKVCNVLAQWLKEKNVDKRWVQSAIRRELGACSFGELDGSTPAMRFIRFNFLMTRLADQWDIVCHGVPEDLERWLVQFPIANSISFKVSGI